MVQALVRIPCKLANVVEVYNLLLPDYPKFDQRPEFTLFFFLEIMSMGDKLIFYLVFPILRLLYD